MDISQEKQAGTVYCLYLTIGFGTASLSDDLVETHIEV